MSKTNYPDDLLDIASSIATRYGHASVTSVHVLYSFLKDQNGMAELCAIMDNSKLLRVGKSLTTAEYNICRTEMSNHLTEYFEALPKRSTNAALQVHQDVPEIMQQMYDNFFNADANDIPLSDDSIHRPLVIKAIIEVKHSEAAQILCKHTSLTPKDVSDYITDKEHEELNDFENNNTYESTDSLETLLSSIFKEGGANGNISIPGGAGSFTNLSGMKDNQPKSGEYLKTYATDLIEEAKESRIDPLIGRENEVDIIYQSLQRRKKSNIIIVGEAGVGKTAIPEGMAVKILNDDVPKQFKNARIFSLETGKLIAGAKYRGDFEERITKVLDEVRELANDSDGKVIIFIDEAHTIVGSGVSKESSLDLANLLKPALASGKISVILATTAKEYDSNFTKDPAFARRFTKLNIDEPDFESTCKIVESALPYFAKHHGVTYEKGLIEQIVTLTNRYMDRHQPDKSLDIVDMAGSKCALQEKETVTLADIANTISSITKRPIDSIEEVTEDKTSNLVNLEVKLKNTVYGQDHAIDELRNCIFEARAGLREPGKPEGIYMFRGPTGVGKTETVKKLSELLALEMVRFDMSEYMEEHTVSKLVGAPPGYAGYDDGDGLLIEAIDRNPHCIILFDEIEKAHPKVMNIFLQVLDDGRLTSSKGKVVNFSNALIIFTTNVGVKEASNGTSVFALGGKDVFNKEAQERKTKEHFSPEFLNRIDSIIDFNPLTKEVLQFIVKTQIANLNVLAKEKGVHIELNKDALDLLVEQGYDPKMGARPLKRVIRKKITQPISIEIISGNLKDGGKVNVSTSNGEFVFKAKTLKKKITKKEAQEEKSI